MDCPVGFDALKAVISKRCGNRIKELLADDGDDRNVFHLAKCARLDDIERYKNVVNGLIDAPRAARMSIRRSRLVAKVFVAIDVDNAGLLSRCTTKKARSEWAADEADAIRFLWSYFHTLAKRAKRSHNNTVNMLKAKYRSVLKTERSMVAPEDDDSDDHDHSCAEKSSEEEAPADDHSCAEKSSEEEEESIVSALAIADAPGHSVATRALPAIADANEKSPELRFQGETFEERMSRFGVPKDSEARKVLFEEFQGAAAAEGRFQVVSMEISDDETEDSVEIIDGTSASEESDEESDASLGDPGRHPPQRPDGCREIVNAAKTFALTHTADTRGHWKVNCNAPKTPRRRITTKQAACNSGSKASSVKKKRSKASGVKPAVVTPEKQPEVPKPAVPDTVAGNKMDATELTQKVMTFSPQFRGKPRRSSLASLFLKMFPEEIVSQLDAEILGKVTDDNDIFESHVVYIVHREERRPCGSTSPLWQILDIKKKALGQVTVNVFGENAFMAATVLSVLATSGLGKDILKVAKEYLC